MKNIKKYVAILAVCLMITALMSGCGTKPVATDTGKMVTLKWLLAGLSEQKDSQLVWQEFNKKLQKQLANTEVKFEMITFADYAEKWKLIAASGEQVDIVWTGFVHDFLEQVDNGCYLELDSLLEKNGADLKKEFPAWIWGKTTVKDKIYAIPNFQQMTSVAASFLPKDLADKYINASDVEKLWTSSENPTQECYDVFDKYLSKLKENNQLAKGVDDSFSRTRTKGYEDIITDIAYIKKNSSDNKVYNALDMPEMKLVFKNMSDWYRKGFIAKDILTSKDPSAAIGKRDGYTLFVSEMLKDEAERRSKTFGFPVVAIPLVKDFYIDDRQSMTSTAISRTSKDPERAMQVLSLVNTEKGRDLYNTLVFGLEKDHYKKIADNRIETIDYTGSPTESSKYGLYNWVVGNTLNGYETSVIPEGWSTYLKDVHNNAQISPIMGFKLDVNPVKVEIAQITAVKGEFMKTLTFGAAPDFDAYYEKYVAKMRAAGVDKVVAEIQKQINEWAKNKK